MSHGRKLLTKTLVVGLFFTAGLSPSPAGAMVAPEIIPDYSNPENWTDEALAAQSIFICSSGPTLWSRASEVRKGIGGIALVGRGASSKLKAQIKSLKSKALHGITPVIASDEEGGDVQRLRSAIYRLPSATTMGTWSDAKVTATAFQYGKRMKSLGVDIAFSPVADLNISGYFISRARRGFSSQPAIAGRKAAAWAAGLTKAGVLPVVKHWPGHGRSVDTHAKPGILPRLSKLKTSDLVPFDYAFAHGVTSAMVGHLIVPDLTEPNTPTSRSPKAIALLRSEIGNDGLIITDSLSMGGATKGVHGNIGEAAILSLQAGVDVALVCSGTKGLLAKVTTAVTNGRLPRAQMVEKAKRILRYKQQLGVILVTTHTP